MSKPKFTKDKPIEVWESPDGWTWRVIRKNQKNDRRPFATWFCFVTSPFCPDGEYGDCYVADIIQNTGNHRAAVKKEGK